MKYPWFRAKNGKRYNLAHATSFYLESIEFQGQGGRHRVYAEFADHDGILFEGKKNECESVIAQLDSILGVYDHIVVCDDDEPSGES